MLFNNLLVVKYSLLCGNFEMFLPIFEIKTTFMKKLFFAIVLNLVMFSGFAQEDYEVEIPEIPVDMVFNKSLYAMTEGNMFMSAEPVAFLVASVLPVSYSMAKEEILGGPPEPEFKNTKLGELTEAGKTFSYLTAEVKSDDGKDMLLEMYVVPIDAQTSVMVSGMYEVKAKASYEKEIKKAALSAKIAQ